MILLDKWQLSLWALRRCQEGYDTPQMRSLLNSQHCYWYYDYIKDREDVWTRIIDEEYIYNYCHEVKDRKELWEKIRDSHWAILYCRWVKDRPEVRRYIKDEYFK